MEPAPSSCASNETQKERIGDNRRKIETKELIDYAIS